MNKWLYRAVGTVGVASGFLLLGGGVAQADEADTADAPAVDPQQLRGMLDDLFTPAAGALSPGSLANDRSVEALPATGTGGLLGGGPLSSAAVTGGPLPSAALAGGPLSGLGASALPVGASPVTTLPAAVPPVTSGAEAARGGGVAAPLLRSTDMSVPMSGDHLNADPALGQLPPGALPPGIRPRVQTGSVGTEVPGSGPVGLDTANGKAQVPALIGDTMAAQRADLFAMDQPTEAQAPLVGSLPVVGGLTRAGSPLTTLAGGLPGAGALPVAGGLPGAAGGLPGAAGGLPGAAGGLPGAGAPSATILPAGALPGAGMPGATTLPAGSGALPGVGTVPTGDRTPPVASSRPILPPSVSAGPQGRHAAPDARPAAARPARHAAQPGGRHAAQPGGRHVAQPGRHAARDNAATEAPLRRVAGSPGGRAAERPVAGEDTDFR